MQQASHRMVTPSGVRLNTVHPTMNRMPDAECETEVFNGFRLGGSHRVAVYKPILVSSTGPCKAFQAVYPSYRWGQQVEIWNSAKADHGARLVNTFHPTNGPQTTNIEFEIRRIRFHERPLGWRGSGLCHEGV